MKSNILKIFRMMATQTTAIVALLASPQMSLAAEDSSIDNPFFLDAPFAIKDHAKNLDCLVRAIGVKKIGNSAFDSMVGLDGSQLEDENFFGESATGEGLFTVISNNEFYDRGVKIVRGITVIFDSQNNRPSKIITLGLKGSVDDPSEVEINIRPSPNVGTSPDPAEVIRLAADRCLYPKFFPPSAQAAPSPS